MLKCSVRSLQLWGIRRVSPRGCSCLYARKEGGLGGLPAAKSKKENRQAEGGKKERKHTSQGGMGG